MVVYAVKYLANPDNSIELATIDNQKYEAIKSVFWNMNSVSFKVETIDVKTTSDYVSSTTEHTS